MKLDDIKKGDKLIADGGFTCLAKGQIVEVLLEDSELAVKCSRGIHFLRGQCGKNGLLIGFTKE